MTINTERLGYRQIEVLKTICKRSNQSPIFIDILEIIVPQGYGYTERVLTKMCLNFVMRGMLTVSEHGAVELTAEARQWLKEQA